MSDTEPRDDEQDRGTHKPGGHGSEGTIPDSPDGVALGVSGEKNTFEPEEDPEASSTPE
jgi:hypothetical protein